MKPGARVRRGPRDEVGAGRGQERRSGALQQEQGGSEDRGSEQADGTGRKGSDPARRMRVDVSAVPLGCGE